MASSYFDPSNNNESIILNVKDKFNTIYAISGEGDNNANNGEYQIYYHNIEISGSNEIDGSYDKIAIMQEEEFFKYSIYKLNDCDYKYIKLTFPNKNSVLNEIWFVYNDQIIDVSLASISNELDYGNSKNIIDEQDTLTLNYDYQNETYFDEIYHIRNAYEIAHRQKMYTAVHPLLGTQIIALGTKIFGNNLFGYRIMGVIFSTMMLPLFYALLNECFKNKYWCNIGLALLCFDFMHYTTARIATLEPFSVFFIIAMYFFMLKALKYNYITQTKKHFLYLAFSGTMMGLAISTKWTGVYGAMGLALIYFIYEIRYLKLGISKNQHIKHPTILLCLWSILWFIVIPLFIYLITFINVPMYIEKANNLKEFINQVIAYNKYMLTYHSTLESSHPFSSRWYEWLLDIRPIWYYVNRKTTSIQTISCFNNPLINLSGIIAIMYCIYHTFKYKCIKTLTLLIMYLSELLPWVMISRVTFAYHYYPSIPFMILIIVYTLYIFDFKTVNNTKYHKYINIYVFICAILFIIFLPVISGFETTYFYVQKFLKWLPTWYFG